MPIIEIKTIVKPIQFLGVILSLRNISASITVITGALAAMGEAIEARVN